MDVSSSSLRLVLSLSHASGCTETGSDVVTCYPDPISLGFALSLALLVSCIVLPNLGKDWLSFVVETRSSALSIFAFTIVDPVSEAVDSALAVSPRSGMLVFALLLVREIWPEKCSATGKPSLNRGESHHGQCMILPFVKGASSALFSGNACLQYLHMPAGSP